MIQDPRPFRVIGRPQRKIEGLAKSSGRAVYTDDIALPGMLHGKILRSPHPHAEIVSIDVSAARDMDGVHAVITGADMPVQYGIIPWTPDEYALCLDRVRFIGDGVAAVAAVDEDTAIRALERIHVEYRPLPAYHTPDEALAATETFIHDPRKAGHNGNITKMVKLEFGEVEAGLEEADEVVEGDYFFEGTTHAPIEPHCAIGLFEPDGKLTVWSATQVPHYLHRELARVLDLDEARVRVVQPLVGGAFGGKSEPFDLEFCVARLSMETGRPVKILYTREEVFYAHRGRHPFHMTYRTGVTRDGKLTSVDARIILDGGAYASFGLVTTYYAGQLLTAPYALPAYRFDSTRVYTNKPPCGPKRGHGSVQPRFAFEVQLDKLAERVGLDPMELRRRNFIGSHTRTVNELRVTSNGFLECLEAVERASDWRNRFRRLPFGQGLGVAGSTYISGTNYPIYPNDMPQSGVQVQIDRSGRVSVFSGGSEIGQGCDSVVGVHRRGGAGRPPGTTCACSGATTDFVPVDLGAYSSRGDVHAGQRMRGRLPGAAGQGAGRRCGRVGMRTRPPWSLRTDTRGTPSVDARSPSGRRSIWRRPASALWGPRAATTRPRTSTGVTGGGTIGASPAYSFTAHVAEVEVDVDTGGRGRQEDLGGARLRASPQSGSGGRPDGGLGLHGVRRGPSWRSRSSRTRTTDGRDCITRPRCWTTAFPTSLDTPALESLIIESNDPEGPYGAKEAGEGPLHPSIPAIANAIYDAIGVRLDRLPFSAPNVWASHPGRSAPCPSRRRRRGSPRRPLRRSHETHAPSHGPVPPGMRRSRPGSRCPTGWTPHRPRSPLPSSLRLRPSRAPRWKRTGACSSRPCPGRGSRGWTPCPWGRTVAAVGRRFVGRPYTPGTLEVGRAGSAGREPAGVRLRDVRRECAGHLPGFSTPSRERRQTRRSGTVS